MQIDIQTSRVVLAPEDRDRIRRRAGFALSHLRPRISRVEVRLADINGARGGVDKQCRVVVILAQGPAAIVEDLDANLATLIDRAMARAGRVAAKRVDRDVRRLAAPPRLGWAV